MAVSFNKSSLLGKELEYIFQGISSGQIGGDQTFSRKCDDFLCQKFGVNRSLVTTSCTHALEMAGILVNIQPGDEVVVPSFTFVSTANAFVLRGAKIVFCDVRADTLNLDEQMLGGVVTERTKLIVPVHYAGVGCNMDEILKVAESVGATVVEDNAHGLFGKYKGRWLGTFGACATQSFHETKNITCGEGGALLINDSSLAERAEIIREKGTDRSKFFRGLVDKYSWVDVGSSYVMSDVLAAFLYGQLEASGSIQASRAKVWNRYWEGLYEWCCRSNVRMPIVPEDCEQAFHMFYLLLPSALIRDKFIAYLREREISAVFHYLPLHNSRMGEKVGVAPLGCPVTEDVSGRLVRLPFYNTLSESEQDCVIDAVCSFVVES